MKKPILCALIALTTLSLFARDPISQPLHIAACTTGSLVSWYRWSIAKSNKAMRLQKEATFDHLMLHSDIDPRQRANFINRIRWLEKQLKSQKAHTRAIDVILALHIFYAGYYLACR